MWIQGALFRKYHRYHRLKEKFGGELYSSDDRGDGRLVLWRIFGGAAEVDGGYDETVLSKFVRPLMKHQVFMLLFAYVDIDTVFAIIMEDKFHILT